MLGRHERAAEWLQIWADLGRAPRTMDAHARALAEYLIFCESGGVDPVTASRAQVAVFVQEPTTRPSARGVNVVSIDSGAGLANPPPAPRAGCAGDRRSPALRRRGHAQSAPVRRDGSRRPCAAPRAIRRLPVRRLRAGRHRAQRCRCPERLLRPAARLAPGSLTAGLGLSQRRRDVSSRTSKRTQPGRYRPSLNAAPCASAGPAGPRPDPPVPAADPPEHLGEALCRLQRTCHRCTDVGDLMSCRPDRHPARGR